MRVLVLGGYGLIGLECVRALHLAGYSVVGLARKMSKGERLFPHVSWVQGDLAKLQSSRDWQPYIQNIDCIVNAAGVLQSGLHADPEAVQGNSIAALVDAISGSSIRFVQISAPGAKRQSTTAFYRSKFRADKALQTSSIDWVILRPGVVFGQNAFGGSQMLRMIAAFPGIQPLVNADARIQMVGLGDLVDAVLVSVSGNIPSKTDVSICERNSRSLTEIVSMIRSWLGYAPARIQFELPVFSGFVISKFADGLGYLGWRSPLRTTATRILKEGVTADPGPWEEISGLVPRSFDRILLEQSATLQERWFARLSLMLPLVIATLSLFFVMSGVIGFVSFREAVDVLKPTPLADYLKAIFVGGGCVLDIGLGLMLMVR
ncbi:MAG: NAD(P)H-binding protein, partial [Cohaesibacteraceae bacterium]|nr:NAD(P)H-binding protein [Cohaesibacteraceae bacterium]